MAVSEGYQAFVLEQLGRVTRPSAKRMFGGVGVYADGLFIAVIDEDRLYFKVDETNRPDFEKAGCEPFRPYNDERTMSYYEVPIEVLEDVDRLRDWTKKVIDVARRARKRKR